MFHEFAPNPFLRSRGKRTLMALVGLLAIGSLGVHATTVRPLNLEELTQKAGRIVSGRCESVEVVHDPVLGPVTRVELVIDRSLKGASDRRMTIRLLGRQQPRGMRTGLIGMPNFESGEELIVFLYPDSRAGLTSPVGFGQGKFVKVRDKRGRLVALNGHGNRGLLKNLSADARRKLGAAGAGEDAPATLAPEMLLEMVERLRPVEAWRPRVGQRGTGR